MCSQNDHPPYDRIDFVPRGTKGIRAIALRRDEGTVLVFRGFDDETGEHIEFAADRRPGLLVYEALEAGGSVLVQLEPYQVLLRWKPPVVKGAHL